METPRKKRRDYGKKTKQVRITLPAAKEQQRSRATSATWEEELWRRIGAAARCDED